jgi:lipoic acid synthetase
MILGDSCTRNCTFCAVGKGPTLPPTPEEPEGIVAAVKKLELNYVVITSVTRDDLPDGGASQFVRSIRALLEYDPGLTIEVLVPDFNGSDDAIEVVINAHPAVLNHNVETVPRLYPEVRPEASYSRSLKLLEKARYANSRLLTKSGLMLGLGETLKEVIRVMSDLRQAGCDILTVGQYLRPSLRHHRVDRYVHPDEFAEYRQIGQEMGFSSVISGPLVRSSFHAAETHLLALDKKRWLGR